MHCPNCGIEASAQQKFCRSCGFNLEKVAQLFAEQLLPVAGDEPQVEKSADLKDQLRRTERWLGIAFYSLMAILLGGISWLIIGKLILKGQVLAGLGLLFFIASAVLTLYFVARREELHEALADRQPLQPAALRQGKSTAKLLPESQPELAPSVTEETTERLATYEAGEAGRNRKR